MMDDPLKTLACGCLVEAGKTEIMVCACGLHAGKTVWWSADMSPFRRFIVRKNL